MVFITGCNNNYQSLNDLAIVSSIIIDKDKDYEYVCYVELYKQDKSEKNNTSYFVRGKGNNIQSAINDAANMVSKKLYLVHTNVVIISEDLANEKINEVFNYLESKVQMNSNYYLMISDDINKLIKNDDTDNAVLGEKISNTLKYSTNSGSMVNYDFMEKLNNYISSNKDIYLSKVTIDNNYINIEDGYYFSSDKLVGSLNSEELKLINLFKKSKNLYFTFNYNDDEFMIKIDDNSIKYYIDNDINIVINIKANIVEVGSNIDIVKSDSIINLNKYASNELTNKTLLLLNKLKENKSDILGINDYIYKVYGKNYKNFFYDNTSVLVNVDINKKGLINKTLGGKNER